MVSIHCYRMICNGREERSSIRQIMCRIVCDGKLSQRMSLAATTSDRVRCTTAPKTTAGSTTSTRTLFLRLVNLNGLAVKGCSIHLGYRRFSVLIPGKSHESKPRDLPVSRSVITLASVISRKMQTPGAGVVLRVPAQTPTNSFWPYFPTSFFRYS